MGMLKHRRDKHFDNCKPTLTNSRKTLVKTISADNDSRTTGQIYADVMAKLFGARQFAFLQA